MLNLLAEKDKEVRALRAESAALRARLSRVDALATYLKQEPENGTIGAHWVAYTLREALGEGGV